MSSTFRKARMDAPPGFFKCEAAGLQWLQDAGGARCVQVRGVDDHHLLLDRLIEIPPTGEAATEFGAALAETHNAGAESFGALSPQWEGSGWFGPMDDPLPMSRSNRARWGDFYARDRLHPLLTSARGRAALPRATHKLLAYVVDRLIRGGYDDDDVPARLHGDLWSGNIMWTAEGVTLIDPAAHGGHRETDLAFLALFGCPFLEAIVDGYRQVQPLRDDWESRICLHQLYPLIVHAVLFGGGYARKVDYAARSALELT